MKHGNEILTLEEFMAFLSIGKNTAYKILSSGEIKAFMLGNRWKIPMESVNEYISKNISSVK